VLENITSDFKLFEHLHKQYYRKSRWFTVRCVGTVSLAQVSLMHSMLTGPFHSIYNQFCADPELVSPQFKQLRRSVQAR
jgi:hypothetical protein